MNNRFIIIIGSYNNAEWVENNIGSVMIQDYPNYKAIYFNDASTDETLKKTNEKINGDLRFVVHNVTERKYKTWFFYQIGTETYPIEDNDILVFLDGDDMLSSENVLSYLNDIYNQTNCWMTYGGMQVWDGGENLTEPFPQNTEIPNQVKIDKLYRKDMWRTSHLKTMRGFLWKKFNKEDLKPEGKFGPCQDDLAIMFAMLEMCPSEKVYRVTEPLYVYNNSIQCGSRGCTELKPLSHLETIIRNIPTYKTVEFVTPTLAGGLGNQMFEIAVAASLAKDNGAVLIVNPEEHILPNQGNNVKKYIDNMFSKIILDSTIIPEYGYRRDECTYTPIPYKPNLKLYGHFQSWKYFNHNRDHIINLFSPRYFLPIAEKITAVQVRRGDYWKFPDHHPQLTTEYFSKAVKLVAPEEVHVFSDDIPWCQANLKLDVPVTYKKCASDWEELLEMSCYKNIIISNSSFGWWAAYLNTRSDKQIYAPSIWFGKVLLAEGFNIHDLVLPDWNII